MTILLVSENFPPRTGGSSRWFWEVYKRLPHSAIVAAGEAPHQEKFDRTHNLRTVRLPLAAADWGVLNLRTLRWYWNSVGRLKKVAKAEGVEQIHCGRTLPEGWIAWLLKQRCGIPYICYAHGEEINTMAIGQPTGILSSRQLRWMLRMVISGADFVIANSESTRRILTTGWELPDSKIRIMHPGVDTKRFVPTESNDAERARLKWQGREVILTVGRLDTRKGHDHMILALHAIKKTNPKVLYAIVGDGERYEFLRELVRRESLTDYVQFLGELNDESLLRCYQQCDLFVLPNRQVGNDIEGFGIVLLEAQACGKAVIAGNSGGTVETLKVPESGRLVSCESPDQLANIVVELLHNSTLRTQMGQAGRQWVMEKFDWSVLVKQAEELFHSRFAGGTRQIGLRPVESDDHA